jgi:hypothetical protein
MLPQSYDFFHGEATDGAAIFAELRDGQLSEGDSMFSYRMPLLAMEVLCT